MAWIDQNSGETASALKTRLDAITGVKVAISKECGSMIVYHNGSSPLKQKQTVEVVEYRGLTEDAAKLLVDCASDSTSIQVWYARRTTSVGGQAQYVAASTKSGSQTTVSAGRQSDGANWFARFTTTTYQGEDGTGAWSTTKPSAATTGVTVQKTKRSVCNAYGEGIGYKLQQITVTVVEYQFLTQTEAENLCTSSDGTAVFSQTYTDTSSVTHIFYYTAGTVVTSTMRYVDEINGWTVDKTTEVTTV